MKQRGLFFWGVLILVAGVLVFISNSVSAKVTGPCANCHTMHNSQGGASVEGFTPFEPGDTANHTLLATTCVGCHSSNLSPTSYDIGGGCMVPVVNYTGGEPTDYLAGGNFYWVQADTGGNRADSKGHNVFSVNPDGLLEAPGKIAGCGNNSCHENLSEAWQPGGGGGAFPDLNGKYACEGCHLHVMHHADDGPPDEYYIVNSKDQGWYRFLVGHNWGSGYLDGVHGGEDPDWQPLSTSSQNKHNEYLGNVVDGNYGFALGNTTTAFCTGCHGIFHRDQKSDDTWIRHPSDAYLPGDAQYGAYEFYDPIAPVARKTLPAGPSSNVTANGATDMVMCLSCHRPHGSPYPDILRWDYEDMQAGTTDGAIAGTGCFVCHTNKDGIP